MAANEAEEASGVLSDFADSPRGFVLGLILTPLIEGLENIVIETLWVVNLVLVGENRGSTAGSLGIADIPLVLARMSVKAGQSVGRPVLETLGFVMRTSVKLGQSMGPWGLIGSAILIVAVIWTFSASLRLGLAVALEAIPGGGAILERL
jgi:hypothetical protein